MVKKLHDMFAGNRFQELRDRLINQGMSGGVNILLFGGPGTGKTETVYQLARHTQRMILCADASKIRSKWVGETEKNTRQLFEQYRVLMMEQEHTPILLFNEADAILGKRSNADNRIDQMENAMQNILLEELEKFEGIFMATTNLEGQLDNAFDRRFLYKLKFEKPGTDARLKLWQSKFPGLKKSILHALNEEFAFTGAQIENIRKKIAIDQVLEPRLKLDLKYFQELARQELLLINGKDGASRNAIGFFQSN
jgi:SpoVK/Ycf46/Vps4 family AAA+-type ATPase